jgi:hypothetical protein
MDNKNTPSKKLAITFLQKVEILLRFFYFTESYTNCQKIIGVKKFGTKLPHTCSANNIDFKISMDLF